MCKTLRAIMVYNYMPESKVMMKESKSKEGNMFKTKEANFSNGMNYIKHR